MNYSRMNFREAVHFGLIGNRKNARTIDKFSELLLREDRLSTTGLPEELIDPPPQLNEGNLLIGSAQAGFPRMTPQLALLGNLIVNAQERAAGREYDRDLLQIHQDLEDLRETHENKTKRFQASRWSYLFPLTRRLVRGEVEVV